MKGNQTQRIYSQYGTIQEDNKNISLENSMRKLNQNGVKSPNPNRHLLLCREIDCEDIRPSSGVQSFQSKTIRSSYELLNEAQKERNNNGFKNRLIEKQKSNIERGRNSTNPFSQAQIMEGNSINNKRQSVDPFQKENNYPAPKANIDLNSDQLETDNFTISMKFLMRF